MEIKVLTWDDLADKISQMSQEERKGSVVSCGLKYYHG